MLCDYDSFLSRTVELILYVASLEEHSINHVLVSHAKLRHPEILGSRTHAIILYLLFRLIN
jgi:hypothetical protein